MSVKVSGSGVAIIAGVVAALFAIYEIAKHLSLLNPLSQNNLANRGFNSTYSSLTGSSGTLGSDLYNIFNPSTGINQTPAQAMCYARNPDGSLIYDSSGTLMTQLCSLNPPGYQTP